MGSILFENGTGQDMIAFRHASAKPRALSSSVSTEGSRFAPISPNLNVVPFRIHGKIVIRQPHFPPPSSFPRLSILFRFVSTTRKRSTNPIFRFCPASAVPTILYRSVLSYLFDSVLCPEVGLTRTVEPAQMTVRREFYPNIP